MRGAPVVLAAVLLAVGAAEAGPRPPAPARSRPPAAGAPAEFDFEALRLAVEDLRDTFGERYPRAGEYLARLGALEADADRGPAARRRLEDLRREALLANPLLDFERLLLVRRRCEKPLDPGLPSNHECNSSLARTGWDNEIAVLSPVRPDGDLRALYRPEGGGYVGELDLHWDGDRLLFTRSGAANWTVWEVRADGTGLRPVSRMPDDVDAFDACYLPDGRIVFGSTASWQSVPCWHGQRRVANLYLMAADGSGVRQLAFDQDHDLHPCLLDDGQVVFSRWDYTGISHIFLRELMVMNPDGTGQRAVYGSNSWYPNALYFPRPVPGRRDRLVCILSGYHGVHRMGNLVLVDTARGAAEAGGIVQRMPGRGRAVERAVRDNLVDDDWPKFLHPWPLSDKYLLVSAWLHARAAWGVYLADVFDNLVLVREEPGWALLEPVPLCPRPRPPAVPDKVDLSRRDAVLYLHDVYAGPGLAGVPRGTVRRLRVLAYHFGYPGLAGPDKVGRGGPWDAMRILGTVPLEADGSALVRVPACTPLAVQALDAEGKAVQLMRSWVSLMPGETASCVGCHERLADVAPARAARALARPPRDLDPWYGPARGFDFEREVQGVLDRYCVGCHDGRSPGRPDLRPARDRPDYRGSRLSDLGVSRLHPKMKADTGGLLRYTPAYEALLPYVRRPSIEDEVGLLVPGEYHADTSELVQHLRGGHQGVRLDAEAWDRLVTWIDLNAPCHGTWGDVYPIPDGAAERRRALARQYGGPADDPEAVPDLPRTGAAPVRPDPPQAPAGEPPAAGEPVRAAGWPMDAAEARARQAAGGPWERSVDLGGGATLRLVRIPAGEFVMGDARGRGGERPPCRVAVARPFWMGATEVTNEQYRRFDASHESGRYVKWHARPDDDGLPLDGPAQPAVRVSWDRAMAFCAWLSARTGLAVSLPTEAQWEYACRAGSDTPFSFGGPGADFSRAANALDRAYAGKKMITGGVEHLDPAGRALADLRFDDGSAVTAPAGSYGASAWGLHDMHGNAAEWTRTLYRPYPYREDDGRNDAAGVGGAGDASAGVGAGASGVGAGGRRVVRGGSFYERPALCGSARRLDYPSWQRVFNVGFRVVAEDAPASRP